MNPARDPKTERFSRTEGEVQTLLDAVETSTHTGTSHAHISSNAMDFDGEVRQRAEPR